MAEDYVDLPGVCDDGEDVHGCAGRWEYRELKCVQNNTPRNYSI